VLFLRLGVIDLNKQTYGFTFNHTMLRVKDIKKSLDFYQQILGFSLVDQRDYASFSLYFLAYINENEQIPTNTNAKRLWLAQRAGVLELTYNHGSENSKQNYHNGNSEPRGFGHICISVPNLEQACARFNQLNVPFQKQPHEGSMRYIAFIKDPDGYWIEIISNSIYQE